LITASIVAFVVGVFCLQQVSTLPSLYWACLILPIAFFAYQLRFSSRIQQASKAALCLLTSLMLGFFWAAGFATVRMVDALPHAWESRSIELTGVVATLPELTQRGERFQFDVDHVLTKGATVPRHISLVFYPAGSWDEVPAFPRAAQFRAGERWRLTVRLKRPHSTQNPHVFDFESLMLANNIRATGSIKAKAKNEKLQDFVWRPQYVIEHLRELAKLRIAHVLTDKQYLGVVQALVMGDDSAITFDDWQVFLRTGTSHLMSISGLHITMLSGLAFALVSFVWRRVPQLASRLPTRKAAVVVGALTALSYSLIAGFSVPTQRTLYMLTVFAIALWSGRQLVMTQVLAFAVLVVVLLDPWAVVSAGFWLSFGAVAMISYALGGRVGQPHWFKVAVQTQWAVTVGMVPLLLMMFHQASMISLVANAFAIPLISFVVTPLALLGSFLPIDAALNLSYQALWLCMEALKWLNQLPNAVWQQHTPAMWTLLPAVVGVVWVLLPRGVPMRWLGLVGFLPMLLIAAPRPAHGEMRITVLDVGQGLSVLVQTATRAFLYDAGPKYSQQSDAGARIVVPFLQGEGISALDGLMVSHDDNDHSGGMDSLLAQMPVTWLASSLPDSRKYSTPVNKMRCFAGQQWVWDDVRFHVLFPTLESYEDSSIKDNNRSCVIKISNSAGSLLLVGDIEKQAEFQLVDSSADGLKSDILVAPHHGSKSSSTKVFIDAVQPKHTVFTAGYLNRFKHPAPKVVARYQDAGSAIHRSDYHGALTINTHSELASEHQISVSSWRKQSKRYWHDDFEH